MSTSVVELTYPQLSALVCALDIVETAVPGCDRLLNDDAHMEASATIRRAWHTQRALTKQALKRADLRTGQRSDDGA